MKTIHIPFNSIAFAFVFTVIGGAAFAQQEVAMIKPSTSTIPKDQVLVPKADYYRSFQAVVFPRLDGTVAVNVEKAPHETIYVRVINNKGLVINEKKLGKRELVNSNYKMTGIPKGTYTFEIASQSKVYRKEVTLD